MFVGGTSSAAVSWSGLTSGQRYLGIAQFLMNGASVAGQTIVEVDATDPLPAAARPRASARTAARATAE